MHLVFNICVKEVISRCFIPTRNDLRFGFLGSPSARQQKISCSNVNGKKVRPCLLLCFVGSKDSMWILFQVKVVSIRWGNCHFSVWTWSLFLAKVVTVSFESCHCFLWMLSEENVDRVSGEWAGVCVGFVLREFQVISVIPPTSSLDAFGFRENWENFFSFAKCANITSCTFLIVQNSWK